MSKSVSLRISLLALPLCLALTGCDKKAEEKKTDDKKADAKKAGDEKAGDKKADEKKAEKPAEPEKVEIKLVEHDLTSADAEWAGWSVQGAEAAKVMADGVKGARVAAGRGVDFDLAFAPKKTDLAELKGNIQKGADASDGKMKLTFSSDTPELLEWVADGYGAQRYNFVMNMKVGDREVTCKNNYMVGIESPEGLAQHKAACATLAKKP